MVETMLSIPVRVFGWLMVVAGVGVLFAHKWLYGLFAVAMGAGLVWAGRWLAASGEVRLARKVERHELRVQRIDQKRKRRY